MTVTSREIRKEKNPLWDGDGRQLPGQPRGKGGKWVKGGRVASAAARAMDAALKESSVMSSRNRFSTLSGRAGVQVPKRVKTRGGYKETFWGAAGGDINVRIQQRKQLPGKISAMQHKDNLKWIKENVPQAQEKYAEQVSRLAMQHGASVSVDVRNKNAKRMLGWDINEPPKAEDKFREKVGELLDLEDKIYARSYKPKEIPKEERLKTVGSKSQMTEKQNETLIQIGATDQQRVKPYRDGNYNNPDWMGKATVGEHKGKWVRVGTNGTIHEINPKDVARLRRQSKAEWDMIDIARSKIRGDSRDRRTEQIRTDAAARAAGLPQNEKEALLTEDYKARAKRAREAARTLGLDPTDSYNLFLATGDKTLIRADDKQSRPLQDQNTLHVMKELRKVIADTKGTPLADRKKAKAQLEAIKQANPHLVRTVNRKQKGPKSSFPESAINILERADASVAAADQTPTTSRQKRVNAPSVITDRGRSTKETQVGTIAADNEKMPSRRARTSGAGTSSRTRRVAAPRAPKRTPKEFEMQSGLPLNAGSKPKQKYTPIKFAPVITPKTRKATQQELEQLFPATKTKPAGVAPMGRENIRVPAKPMKSGFGEFSYMYDHHERKNKGKVTPNKKQYSQAHDVEGQMRKFERVARMSEHMSELDARIKRDAKTNDTAGAVAMMRILAMRPSSEKGETRLPERDKNGDIVRDAAGEIVYGEPIQTFGATTLERRHVTINGRVVTISLTGKAAHEINIKTDDPTIVEMLKARLSKKGKPEDKVFNTTPAATLNWIKETMPDAQNKDLRTYVATTIAKQLVESMPTPTTVAEFKNAILDVTETTANQLQHGATMSKNSYIDPRVFEGWAVSAGVDFDLFMHPRTGRNRVIKPLGWETKTRRSQ